MSDYTPTTAEVREDFACDGTGLDERHRRRKEFDRWLAAHEAEVVSKALKDAIEMCVTVTHETGVKGRAVSDVELFIRAEEFERGLR